MKLMHSTLPASSTPTLKLTKPSILRLRYRAGELMALLLTIRRARSARGIQREPLPHSSDNKVGT